MCGGRVAFGPFPESSIGELVICFPQLEGCGRVIAKEKCDGFDQSGLEQFIQKLLARGHGATSTKFAYLIRILEDARHEKCPLV